MFLVRRNLLDDCPWPYDFLPIEQLFFAILMQILNHNNGVI